MSQVEYMRRYRAKHRSLGLCVSCPRQAEPGKARCSKCRSRDNQTVIRLKLQRQQRGLCTWGGCGRRAINSYHCEEHAERVTQYTTDRQQLHQQLGLCIRCKSPALPDSLLCEVHREKSRIANRIRTNYQGGLKGGRPRKRVDLDKMRELAQCEGSSVRSIAAGLGISEETLRRNFGVELASFRQASKT